MSKRDLDYVKHDIYDTKAFKNKVADADRDARQHISAEAIRDAGASRPIDYYQVDRKLKDLEGELSERLHGGSLSPTQRKRCAEALIAVRVLRVRNGEERMRQGLLVGAMSRVDLSSYNATRRDLPVLRAAKKALAKSRKRENRKEKQTLKEEAKRRGNISAKALSSQISDAKATISVWAEGDHNMSYVLERLIGKTNSDHYNY